MSIIMYYVRVIEACARVNHTREDPTRNKQKQNKKNKCINRIYTNCTIKVRDIFSRVPPNEQRIFVYIAPYRMYI